MHPRARQIIDQLNLQPHPEGGYYKEQYRSEQQVKSPLNDKLRPAITQIYFLLTGDDVSRWHAVAHDEIWHFYEGDPLHLYTLQDGAIHKHTVGNHDDSFTHPLYYPVEAGVYQAAESSGEYTLVGCSVAPGFDFDDFSFMHDLSLKAWIMATYPDYQKFI